MDEIIISGWIFDDNAPEQFFRGYVVIDKEQKVIEIGKGKPKNTDIYGIVTPVLFNAHTHIGDCIYTPEITGSFDDVVGFPHGLKYQVMKSEPSQKRVAIYKKEIEHLARLGIGSITDFREEGLNGIKLIKSAFREQLVNGIILGRPLKNEYNHDELRKILNSCEGIGISAMEYWNYDELKKVSVHTKKEKKIFGLHVSEAKRDNIDQVLDLKPDFVVHCLKATESDIERLAQENVPVIICARSNLLFGEKPPINRLLKYKIRIMLGTDNFMLTYPDLFRELEIVYRLTKLDGGYISPKSLLQSVITIPAETFNIKNRVGINVGEQLRALVFALDGDNPAYKIVVNGAPEKIIYNSLLVKKLKVNRER